MPGEPALILQVPNGSRVEVQLAADPPAAVSDRDVVVEIGATDSEGVLESPPAGEVVLSVPSPQTFRREPEELHRVLAHPGTGTEPLVVVVEAAEELTDSDLRLVLDAARQSPRPVILRVIRDA
jgi:hypothetical protein